MKCMSQEETDEIRLAWAKFLEVANNRLMQFFFGIIPESLLPYPKHKIMEAMQLSIDYLQANGDEQTAQTLAATLPVLDMYTDDRLAMTKAYQRLKV